MLNIDKQKFGTFVAMLRKEKGITQKELAEQLFISDKAVSKWETAVSVPKIDLLIPLANILGVTVTELLMCQRMVQDNTLSTTQVEQVVQTAISYSDEEQTRAYHSKFGIYFCFFAKEKLPVYYDENRICVYTDGLFEMNLPGLSFNNSNWGRILKVVRIWAISLMLVYPIISYIETILFTGIRLMIVDLFFALLLALGGLFIPTYIVGKKYESKQL